MADTPLPYPYLVRAPGLRGRTVAHLADERGEARCGLRLGERWELTRTTARRVCGRCWKVADHKTTQDHARPD